MSFQRRWRIPDTPLRRVSILRLANRRYRGWRAKLSKDYSKYDNDEDRRRNRPKEVSEKQWESLITYFGTDEFKVKILPLPRSLVMMNIRYNSQNFLYANYFLLFILPIHFNYVPSTTCICSSYVDR